MQLVLNIFEHQQIYPAKPKTYSNEFNCFTAQRNVDINLSWNTLKLQFIFKEQN